MTTSDTLTSCKHSNLITSGTKCFISRQRQSETKSKKQVTKNLSAFQNLRSNPTLSLFAWSNQYVESKKNPTPGWIRLLSTQACWKSAES